MATDRKTPTVIKSDKKKLSPRQQQAHHIDPEFEPNQYRMDDETRQKLQRARAIYAGAAVFILCAAIWNLSEGSLFNAALVTFMAVLFGILSFIIHRKLTL